MVVGSSAWFGQFFIPFLLIVTALILLGAAELKHHHYLYERMEFAEKAIQELQQQQRALR